MEYTKGGWKVINEVERGIGKGMRVIPDMADETGIYAFACEVTGKEAFAAARLIAASPLYHEAACSYLDGELSLGDFEKQLQVARAKAEGR